MELITAQTPGVHRARHLLHNVVHAIDVEELGANQRRE